LEKCPFFAGTMANMPAVSSLLKQTYCLGDKNTCARYLVSSAGKPVPADLFPNDTQRAKELLQS
ncbi:MAG TPA: hypothetical protein VMU24_07570, partial [Candidatus Acidoferrales bacterium]|nr:hypothetical protein [Candidatus Acidoferrales bacterium]